MNDRSTINPQVSHGQTCIQGTRILVHQLLQMPTCRDSVEGLLQEYPSLSRADILACLDFAASLSEGQDSE